MKPRENALGSGDVFSDPLTVLPRSPEIFVDVDDVLAELENSIGSSAQDTQLKLSQLVSRSNDMHFELSNSIAENKAVMAHNLEVEKEDEQAIKDASATALQRRLYKHYGLSAQDIKDSPPEIVKKSKINFFRRSA